MNNHSEHPMKMKLNSMKEMNKIIERISQPTYIDSSRREFEKFLGENSYSSRIISKI